MLGFSKENLGGSPRILDILRATARVAFVDAELVVFLLSPTSDIA